MSLRILDCLQAYHWPGNLRELKNQMQRAVLFSRDEELCHGDLTETLRKASPSSSGSSLEPLSLAERVAQIERRILEDELQKHNDCRTATARTLGISRVGLYKKMRRYGMM